MHPMSDDHQHLDPFHDPDAGNLADVLRAFEAMPDQSPARKGRVRAAVSTISRMLKKRPDLVSAQATFVMRQFKRLKNLPTGLSAKSLANCKTELRYLLRTICGKGARSWFRPLSLEW